MRDSALANFVTMAFQNVNRQSKVCDVGFSRECSSYTKFTNVTLYKVVG